MKRTIDGRVQLKRKNGTWVSVRLDMEVPGAILLRDTKTNGVYALETDSLPQVCYGDVYASVLVHALNLSTSVAANRGQFCPLFKHAQ